MIIDAKDLILGRFATIVAKKALLGEKINIVNCEEAVITGDRKIILAKFRQRRERGVPLQGPYYPKQADKIVKRTIRGMLPYKQEKGNTAFKNVMCYVGVPEEFKGQKMETFGAANISKVPNLKYLKIGEISRQLGAKI